MVFAFGLSLCALEYGTPLLDRYEMAGDDDPIDLVEIDEVPVTIRKTQKPKPKINRQVQPKIEVASIIPTKIEIFTDPIIEYPDFDFDMDEGTFFSPDSVNGVFAIPFHEATEKPEFPGGEKALYEFLGKHLKYPRIDKSRGRSGKVHVEFIVGRNGKIDPKSVKILGAPSETLGAEAARVVRLMPKWKPGKQRTKSVPVIFVLPVNFRVT